MIYLASPYSSADPAVREERYEKVSELAAALKTLGHVVFAPIAYSHPLAVKFGMAGDWKTWRCIDIAFLQRCEEMWIYELPGWQMSVGVGDEMAEATELQMPIRHVSPEQAALFIEAARILRGGTC